MVRKIVAGMARMPLTVFLGVGLLALAVLLGVRQRPAVAATFSSPFWTFTGAVQPKACANCGCEMPSPFVLPGVSVLTGGLVQDFPIASSPTMLGSFGITLRWRSEISGATDFGLGIVPTFMTTVEETIINVGNPMANGGHTALVRLGSGGTVSFTWNGSAYTTADCCFRDTGAMEIHSS